MDGSVIKRGGLLTNHGGLSYEQESKSFTTFVSARIVTA